MPYSNFVAKKAESLKACDIGDFNGRTMADLKAAIVDALRMFPSVPFVFTLRGTSDLFGHVNEDDCAINDGFFWSCLMISNYMENRFAFLASSYNGKLYYVRSGAGPWHTHQIV